jgi:Trypsin-like peptidase domain
VIRIRSFRNGLAAFLLVSVIGCAANHESAKIKAIVSEESKIFVPDAKLKDSIGKLYLGDRPLCTAFSITRSEIMTAMHCIKGADSEINSLNIRLADKRKLVVLKIKELQPDNDLVSLKLEDRANLTPLEMGKTHDAATLQLITAHSAGSEIGISGSAGYVTERVAGASQFFHDANTFAGYSGSPILQNSQVVGVHLGSTSDATKNIGIDLSKLESSVGNLKSFKPENPFAIFIGTAVAGWAIGKALDTITSTVFGQGAAKAQEDRVTAVLPPAHHQLQGLPQQKWPASMEMRSTESKMVENLISELFLTRFTI